MSENTNTYKSCATCVMYSKPENECKGTSFTTCPDGCAFHVTNAQRAENEQNAYARLRTLGVESQCAISDQYYNGKMPWVLADTA